MAASGKIRDENFAHGFLTNLARHMPLLSGTRDHCRPRAELPRPFGRIEGDVCCVLHHADESENTLLIVEREGSAPGNERNILKWFQALESGVTIEVRQNNRQLRCDFKRVSVLLAFCMPDGSGWSNSDFKKTIAFCRLLSRLLNQHQTESDLPFRFGVEEYPSSVGENEWGQCGEYFADILVK